MSSQEKLRCYLQLAREVRSIAEDISNEASQRLRAEYHTLNLRDRVLIGLAVKMYNSFEALVKDASRESSEAVHHLKTLIETFIYFHWVGQNTEETRAKLVFAHAAYRKLVFFNENPGYAGKEVYEEWEKAVDDTTRGLEPEWEKFKKRSLESLADDVDPNLASWYDRAYRLACQPAHISDLVEYMPRPNTPIQLGGTHISHLWANIALDFGLHVMFDLMKNVSDIYGLEFEERIATLGKNHSAVRVLPI